MSGRRNHILPRLLMRGFLSSPPENTWYFRKNEPPKEVGINSIGVERDYYRHNGHTLIDKKMTIDEGQYGTIISNIRKYRRIPPSDYTVLDKFIIDLYIRSKNMTHETEKSYLDLASLVFSEEHQGAFIHEAVKRLIPKIKRQKITELRETTMRQHGQKKALPILQLQAKQITLILESPQFKELLHELITPLIPLFKDQLTKSIPKEIKSGQLDALHSLYFDPTDTTRTGFTSWSLITSESNDIILGDVGPIFSNRTKINPLIWNDDKDSTAYLPISSNIILIGRTINDQYILNIDDINRATSFLSNYFIISPQNNDHISHLSKSIGSSRQYTESQNTFIENWFNTIAIKTNEIGIFK
jgi:hypothetical protein